MRKPLQEEEHSVCQAMRKPLQEDEHSAGQASEEVGEVGRGQRRMGCYRQWCSGKG